MYNPVVRSPFPGMDPYLEAHWLDVQTSLVTYARDRLQSQLGDDLVARAEERLVVEDPMGEARTIGPDVRVVEIQPKSRAVLAEAGVAVADALTFSTESEPQVQRYIEIVDLTSGGRVITVIEFLSPSNKLPGDGREKYQRKQRECRAAGVNLVEIDLTRAGRRELLVHRWAGARLYDSTYQVSIWRAAWPSRCDLYAIKLDHRLPAIPIPLRREDPEAVLDLQALIDSAYAASRYDRTTDYGRPPSPPLEGDDAAWAERMLKGRGS